MNAIMMQYVAGGPSSCDEILDGFEVIPGNNPHIRWRDGDRIERGHGHLRQQSKARPGLLARLLRTVPSMPPPAATRRRRAIVTTGPGPVVGQSIRPDRLGRLLSSRA